MKWRDLPSGDLPSPEGTQIVWLNTEPIALMCCCVLQPLSRPVCLIARSTHMQTEIARRLAKLAGAPFIKVEATKYTEVGFHGKDVDTMIKVRTV